MSRKQWIITVVVIVAAAVLAAGLYFGTRPETGSGEKSFTVTVVHADGSEKVLHYTSNEEYLGTVLQAEGLVEGYQGDFGLYMEKVDGEEAIYADTGAYWSFYIGEEYALTGIDKTPIEDAASYKLVYEVNAVTEPAEGES